MTRQEFMDFALQAVASLAPGSVGDSITTEIFRLCRSGAVPETDVPAGAVMRTALENVAARYCGDTHPAYLSLKKI